MVELSEVPLNSNSDPKSTEKFTSLPTNLNPNPKRNPSDHALRVAYIMRSYLAGTSSAGGDAGVAGDGSDCCKAMMEVMRSDNSRWTISRVILEHSHSTKAQPMNTTEILPAVGMSFDSVSMAKAFYTAYSEKLGFDMNVGLGKRSKGLRTLAVQKFFCSKGGSYKKIKAKNNKEEAQVDTSKKKQTNDELNSNEAEDNNVLQNSRESKLLRELGVRVSKYSIEERRDIIRKYLKKKNSRRVVDRSIKFPSRQALAERRQRGFGGKFLSKEDSQILNRQEEPVEEEPEVLPEVITSAGGAPVVGMLFENEDKAYEYYVNYAGNKGFSVRKGWLDKSSRNVTRSRVYVCSREGFRPKKSSKEVNEHQPERRTGCPARMSIKITSTNKYRVTEIVLDHNHQLAAPLDIQMLTSQISLPKSQLGRSQQNANLIPSSYKNYIRTKRMKDMKIGDARAILEYLQKMKGENPSFYYAIQVDEDDQMTTIFWADARSISDYYYFGDVVCFDTSFKYEDYDRPFVQFFGVDNHKQPVIFGSAFLYDETADSYKWLFETFKSAMNGKQPVTIFTDKCSAISDATVSVYAGVVHRIFVKHIYQDLAKHLKDIFLSSNAFGEDMSRCLYDFEEEDDFLSAWRLMLEKYNLKDNEYLVKLFGEKEMWASVYGRETFSADVYNALRNENSNTILKEYLNLNLNLSEFFKQYDKLIKERRYFELQTDYHGNKETSGIASVRLLWQAANSYTPGIFDMFRIEYELFMDCTVYSCGEAGTLSQYEVSTKEKSKTHFVRFDSSDNTIICTCKKFDYVGVLCCHVIKVLDFRNIKELPPQYILKRWRKDAKVLNLRENINVDCNSTVSQRYNALCRLLYKIVDRAADDINAYTLMVSQSDQLLEQVERILQTKSLERPPITNNTTKTVVVNVDGQNTHKDSNSGSQQSNGKRKDRGVRQKNQNGADLSSRRQRSRKGQSDEVEFASREVESSIVSHGAPSQLRVPSNQFLAPSILLQGSGFSQYGLGTSHGFQPLSQFGQDPTASALQQQFHVGTHMVQNTMQGFPNPDDMHALQFGGSNQQLDPQCSDQGQCNIPVWDFL